jgi:hypothetical protein
VVVLIKEWITSRCTVQMYKKKEKLKKNGGVGDDDDDNDE